MVGKLIKRDIKDSVKYYGPIQVLIIVLFVGMALFMNSVMNSYQNLMNIMATVSIIAVVAIVFGLLILSVLANIYILYTSIYGNRGYDLFTMPVSSMQIIISKLATVIIWTFISGVTAMLGLFIFLTLTGNLSDFMAGVVFIIENISVIIQGLDIASLGIFAIQGFTNLMFSSILLLFCGAIVNSSKVQKSRGVIAVVLYYLLNMAVNILETFVIPTTDPLGVLFLSTSTVFALTVFKLAFMGLMIYGVKWIWENKLEVL